MSRGVEWPAGACFVVFVYKCVYMDGETEPLQQGPHGSVLPSPALYEAVFWTRAQDQAWGTLLHSSLSRLSLTLHQLGRHSTLCVLVLEGRCSFQLLLSESETNQSGPQIISSPASVNLWGDISRSRHWLSRRKDSQSWLCVSFVEWRTWWHRAVSSSGAWHIRPWGGGIIAGWCHADAC